MSQINHPDDVFGYKIDIKSVITPSELTEITVYQNNNPLNIILEVVDYVDEQGSPLDVPSGIYAVNYVPYTTGQKVLLICETDDNINNMDELLNLMNSRTSEMYISDMLENHYRNLITSKLPDKNAYIARITDDTINFQKITSFFELDDGYLAFDMVLIYSKPRYDSGYYGESLPVVVFNQLTTDSHDINIFKNGEALETEQYITTNAGGTDEIAVLINGLTPSEYSEQLEVVTISPIKKEDGTPYEYLPLKYTLVNKSRYDGFMAYPLASELTDSDKDGANFKIKLTASSSVNLNLGTDPVFTYNEHSFDIQTPVTPSISTESDGTYLTVPIDSVHDFLNIYNVSYFAVMGGSGTYKYYILKNNSTRTQA